MSDQRVGSWFPVPDESELPDSLRGLFAKARENLGFVPNVFRTWAFRPEGGVRAAGALRVGPRVSAT